MEKEKFKDVKFKLEFPGLEHLTEEELLKIDVAVNTHITFDNLPIETSESEIKQLLGDAFGTDLEFPISKICDFCNKSLDFSHITLSCEQCQKTYDICEDCSLTKENKNICHREH